MAQHRLDSHTSGQGSTAGVCEHSHEILVSIKGREFLEKLNDDQLLKKDSALWSKIIYDYSDKTGIHVNTILNSYEILMLRN
jgi:hypothetical protein